MSEKVLFVDDEEHILHSIKRQLRKRFDISTASGGEQALEILQAEGPFAVVVSDMRMPGMDGITLLTKIRDLYPETVRLMLTGNADQETAIEAVNKGQIFRFLNKPCPTPTLVTSIALALRQYRLLMVEKELLDNTLRSSVKVLSELLCLANPGAFSAGNRIKGLVVELGERLDFPNIWQLEVSALMSQIGCITLPVDVINKVYSGQVIEEEEEEMFKQHPKVGANLLKNIPRLEYVAGIIENQLLDFDELQEQQDLAYEVAVGAQILRIVIDHDKYLFRGMNHGTALRELKKHGEKYDTQIMQVMQSIKIVEDKFRVVSMKLKDITIGMVAEEDIVAKNGVMIAPKGQKITWPVLQGLKNFVKQVGVKEPIMVRVENQHEAKDTNPTNN